MAGLLVGALVFTSWIDDTSSAKHQRIAHGHPLQHKLDIIDFDKLKAVDAEHEWVVMILYFMHGKDGKGHERRRY